MSQPTPSRLAPSPDAIDLGGVARRVVRKLPVLLVVSSIVGAGTAGVLSTMAPKYQSQALLKVRGIGTSETSGQPDKEAVGTHVRDLMSTELALKMSKTLQLTARPEFNSALEPDDLYGRGLRSVGIGAPKAGETDEDRLMQAYFKNVRAYQVRDTRSVVVDCTSSSARFSADCANALADLYRESLSGRSVIENTDVRGKLAPQLERLTREAAEAESLATEFRGKANLFQGGAQATQLKDQQLSELTAEMTRVATARGEAETRATAAREMSARGMAAANPDVQKSALIPRMEEQRVVLERQISELSATLLPGHPRMKQLHAELVGLQGQIRAEVLKVVESLANDARIAADREAATRRRIDEMKRTVVSSAPDTAKLAQLDNQAKAKRVELERLQRQYEAAASSAGAGVGAVEIEIVSRAYPSNEKVFPKIGTMAGLAAFSALILGLALTLTRELVRGARPSAIPAQSMATTHPGPSVRPASPTFAAAVPRPTIISSEASPLAVAATVATLSAAAQNVRGFRVLMTGGEPESEGVQETLAVCRALADHGRKVLVLAWQGAGPGLAQATGVSATPGTAQLLVGDVSLEDAIQKDTAGHVDVIVSGDSNGGAIDGDSAAMVLDALDDLYDIVVVNGPTGVAGELFAAVQGRFDAGVVVSATAVAVGTQATVAPFLGFDVPDFLVVTQAPISDPAARRRPDALRRTLDTAGVRV